MIPMVVGVLGMVCKDFGKRLRELETRDKIEAIQTATLLRSAKICLKSPEDPRRDPCERSPYKTVVKNS